jgi:hypothetical protein
VLPVTGEQRRGTPGRASLIRFVELPCRNAAAGLLGQRWLTVQNQHVLGTSSLRGKYIVLFLEPHKLGFQVANTLLETAHLRDHAGIGTADVAE